MRSTLLIFVTWLCFIASPLMAESALFQLPPEGEMAKNDELAFYNIAGSDYFLMMDLPCPCSTRILSKEYEAEEAKGFRELLFLRFDADGNPVFLGFEERWRNEHEISGLNYNHVIELLNYATEEEDSSWTFTPLFIIGANLEATPGEVNRVSELIDTLQEAHFNIWHKPTFIGYLEETPTGVTSQITFIRNKLDN